MRAVGGAHPRKRVTRCVPISGWVPHELVIVEVEIVPPAVLAPPTVDDRALSPGHALRHDTVDADARASEARAGALRWRRPAWIRCGRAAIEVVGLVDGHGPRPAAVGVHQRIEPGERSRVCPVTPPYVSA